MNATILKYETGGLNYLIFDTERNELPLDARTIRTICARNFGLGSQGILTCRKEDGCFTGVCMYDPSGEERGDDPLAVDVFCRYLRDMGEEEKARKLENRTGAERTAAEEASLVGRIYLTDDFARRNHLTGWSHS